MEIPEKELRKFRAATREQCGVIIKTPAGLRVVEVENVAPDSREDYAIEMQAVQEIQDRLSSGEAIVGFLHTHLAHHPAGPSDNDFDGSVIPEMENVVYHPVTGTLTWYRNLTEAYET